MSIQLATFGITTTDGTEQTLYTSPAGAIVTRLVLDFNDAAAGAFITARFTMGMDTGGPIVTLAESIDIDALTAAGIDGWQSDDQACAVSGTWSVELTAGSNFDVQWEVYTT